MLAAALLAPQMLSASAAEPHAKSPAHVRSVPRAKAMPGDLAPVLQASPKHKTPAYTTSEQSLVRYLVRGWRVKERDAHSIVSNAVAVGRTQNVDPLMILSIIAVESSFRKTARNRSGARGLMQVHVPAHREKFDERGGRKLIYDVRTNIEVGTKVFRDYLDKKGTVRGALQCYVGACWKKKDAGYGHKVLVEHSRMQVAANGRTDQAVSLLRRKKAGPGYLRSAGTRADAGFARWARFSGWLPGAAVRKKNPVKKS